MNVPSTTGINHYVLILKDNREQENPYIVVPGRLMVEPGDEVTFKNLTDIDITIQFAQPSPFDVSAINLKPKNGEKQKVMTSVSGGYYYEVECDNGLFAQGSRPIIIVYDKIP